MDAAVVDFIFAIRPFVNREFCPLGAGAKHFENIIEYLAITDFALGPALGQGKVR